MKTRSFRLLMPILLMTATITACAPTSARRRNATDQRPTTSLWKVTSAHRTLYLAGEPGGMTASGYPLPKPMRDAFARSAELITEGDPRPPKDPKKFGQFIIKLGLLPSGNTLPATLTDKQLNAVKKALTACNLPMSRIERMRPWLAFLVLRNACNAKSGGSPTDQMGAHLYAQAKQRHMRTTPLEGVKYQVKMFASFPDKLMAAWLARNAKVLAKPSTSGASDNQTWRTGNIAKVAQSGHRFVGHPKLYKLLVTDRNHRWMHVLVNRLQSDGKPVFVAVGLGHLVHKGNLLDLLRAHGYTVTQM